MALNFPSNTTQPYIDPVSGLKYIFNTAVGAWETAIQPPVIVSDTAPDISIPGFMWWDSIGGSLYVYYKDTDSTQWVEAVPTPNSDRNVLFSDEPPPSPDNGDMWWCTKGNDGGYYGGGRLYIYYQDNNGVENWIDASPNVGGGSGGGGSYDGPTISSGPNAPTGADQNDLWYDTTNGILKIYDGGLWKETVDFDKIDIGVLSLTVTAPLKNNGTASNPNLSINKATTGSVGTVRFATQSEVNAGTSTDTAVTPGSLQLGISNYLPDATETIKGVVKLATQAEVNTGTNDSHAITPKKLKSSLPVLGLDGIPTGTVISFAGQTAPTGYLICDGSEVDRIEYDVLYATIGTVYGPGDGSTTFNLPDLRGEFIRGWSKGGGTQRPDVDVGRDFGSTQGQSIQSHSHSMPAGAASTSGIRPGGGNRSADTTTSNTNVFPSDPDAETRPRNVAMLYCIKF